MLKRTRTLFDSQKMNVQRSRMAMAVFVVTALSLQCHQAAVDPGSTLAAMPDTTPASAVVTSAAALTGSDVDLARRDPLAYIQKCLDHYRRSVHDRIGPVDMRLKAVSDWEFNLRLWSQGTVGFIDEILESRPRPEGEDK